MNDPLIQAMAEAIRRAAIAEYDDRDGMVVAEGYPYDQARAALTALSDLVAFIPDAVALFRDLPPEVQEEALARVAPYVHGFRAGERSTTMALGIDGVSVGSDSLLPYAPRPTLPDPIKHR